MATISSPQTQSPAPGTPRIKSPSIADTPTSSTRGSIDLPLTARPQPGQPPRRGNRAALRDYYNLKSKPGAPAPVPGAQGDLRRTGSITSTTSDISTAPSIATLTENTSTTSSLTAQLDNTDFDAEGYIHDLLAKSSLRDILKVEATLVSEIRNLDGERKALVYDNYSKLIKAVGTIGEMQRGMNDSTTGGLREVKELESKIEGLRASVTEIVGQKDMEDGEARMKRRGLKEDKRKKEVVRWVLDAPDRLAKLVDGGKQDEADKEWKVVKSYLDKWTGVKGVEDIRRRCEEVVLEHWDDRKPEETSDG